MVAIYRSGEAQQQLDAFNAEILALINAKTDWLGSVLKCHLIIEHYMDQYLHMAYPTMVNIRKARLTFSQKLEMINNPQTLSQFYCLSIKSLNSLRNKFAHRISYSVIDEDLSEIKRFMNTWDDALGEARQEGLALLSRFTLFVCGDLNTTTRQIEKQGNGFGLPGYLNWLKDMGEG